MRLLSTVLLVANSLSAAAAVQAEDTKPDTEGIQGTWRIVKWETSPKMSRQEERDLCRRITLVFDGEKVKTVDSSNNSTQESTFKLDPNEKPKTVDFAPVVGPEKGKVYPAIYELKGDDLKLVCSQRTGQQRPTEFKVDPDSHRILYELKRVK